MVGLDQARGLGRARGRCAHEPSRAGKPPVAVWADDFLQSTALIAAAGRARRRRATGRRTSSGGSARSARAVPPSPGRRADNARRCRVTAVASIPHRLAISPADRASPAIARATSSLAGLASTVRRWRSSAGDGTAARSAASTGCRTSTGCRATSATYTWGAPKAVGATHRPRRETSCRRLWIFASTTVPGSRPRRKDGSRPAIARAGPCSATVRWNRRARSSRTGRTRRHSAPNHSSQLARRKASNRRAPVAGSETISSTVSWTFGPRAAAQPSTDRVDPSLVSGRSSASATASGSLSSSRFTVSTSASGTARKTCERIAEVVQLQRSVSWASDGVIADRARSVHAASGWWSGLPSACSAEPSSCKADTTDRGWPAGKRSRPTNETGTPSRPSGRWRSAGRRAGRDADRGRLAPHYSLPAGTGRCSGRCRAPRLAVLQRPGHADASG